MNKLDTTNDGRGKKKRREKERRGNELTVGQEHVFKKTCSLVEVGLNLARAPRTRDKNISPLDVKPC